MTGEYMTVSWENRIMVIQPVITAPTIVMVVPVEVRKMAVPYQ